MQELKEYVLSFDDVYEYDDKMYLSSGCFNGFTICNMEGKVISIESFPDIGLNDRFNHKNIHRIGDKLFFTPDHIKGIHELNLTSNTMRFFPIHSVQSRVYRCADSYVWGDKIWLFCTFKNNSIICYDPMTHEYKSFDSLVEPIPVETEKTIIFHSKLTYNNEHVYGVKNNSNKIVHINLKQKTTEIITISSSDSLFGVVYLNGKLYITMYKSYSVIEYDLVTRAEKLIALDKSLTTSNRQLIYSCLIVYGDKVYLVNSQEKYVARIDGNTVKKFCDFPEEYALLSDLQRRKCRPFYNINIWDKGIRFFPVGANMMVKVDISKKEAYGIKIKLDKNWIDNEYKNIYFNAILKSSVKDKVPIRENEWSGIEMFIDYLCEDK